MPTYVWNSRRKVFCSTVLGLSAVSSTLLRVFRLLLFVLCPGISIKNYVEGDSVTGLSTTTSTLEYSAEKADAGAQFSCRADHPLGDNLVSSPMTFTITCKSLISLPVVCR